MSVNLYDRKDRRGGGYAKRKFTLEEAELIRLEYAKGLYTQHQLAVQYSVSQSIINKILRLKTYLK